MSERRYSLTITSDRNGTVYQITDMGGKGYWLPTDPVVWTYPYNRGDEDPYPKAVRDKYEELCGRPEFVPFDDAKALGTTENIVEMLQDDESDNAFDQPCKYGHRVDGHAVYCHNEGWLYAPTKCRRTWYTGGEIRDEDCRGFSPNPRLVPVS